MYYPQLINENILEYMYENNLKFNNRKVSWFINSSDFIVSTDQDLAIDKSKLRDARFSTFLGAIAGLGPLVYWAIHFANKIDASTGSEYILNVSITVVLLVVTVWLASRIGDERKRYRFAQEFYQEFTSWMKQKSTLTINGEK